MTSGHNLHKILENVAGRMLADFEESAAIKHNPSKGTVRERDLQRAFLEKYLPAVASVRGSGELVSADGQVSGQCDLMVVDAETPPLWIKEDYAAVPAECCHAVIEVKSNLTGDQLKTSWAAAKKVKSLPRTAYRPGPSPTSLIRTAFGREWTHAFPIHYLMFAYEGARLDTLAAQLSALAKQDPDPAMGIDAVYVLNRGTVGWATPSTLEYYQRGADSLTYASTCSPGAVLLFMLTALNDLVANGRYNDSFDIRAYITQSLGAVDGYWKDGEQRLAAPDS